MILMSLKLLQEQKIWRGIQLNPNPLQEEYNGKKRKDMYPDEIFNLMDIDQLLYTIGCYELSYKFSHDKDINVTRLLCKMIKIALFRLYTELAEFRLFLIRKSPKKYSYNPQKEKEDR